MVTIESDFEDAFHEASLNNIEQWFEEEIGPQLIEVARENWRAYADRNDYDIDHIPEDAELFVERDGDSIAIRVEFPELTALFEWGVDPHTINGEPLLHFYYERIDQWVTTESVDWGSETGGIPEARAIRDALHHLRREIQSA
jgi:hypothetical protein